MAKGYVAAQTDLSGILDITGTFNCVSSATIYNVLGRPAWSSICGPSRSQITLFSILYDGTNHADYRGPPTASGFNPARDRAAQEDFEKKTGFPLHSRQQPATSAREIGEAGLVAITYYNHGVTLIREKRYHEALLAYFRAMSLDQEFNSAVKNALASLGNWSRDLAAEGKFEEAVNVLGTGVELAPKDATLVHNRKVVWGDWAMANAQGDQSRQG